jgi:predicted ATPase/class 3 adenylate cyclase
MAELPSGTVTFLFTDIEGSTRLLARLRDRYADVLAEHQRLLRAACDAHDGHEVHTEGDAFFVAFGSASDAIAAAVSAQRGLASQCWLEGVEIRVRMGIHTGQAILQHGDYVGLDVHRAARICAAGHGGQVLISRSTRELVADALPQDVALRDLGEHRLRDLDRPEHLFQVVAGDLPSDFPPLGSVSPVADGVNGVPPSPNRTIGRDEDLRTIEGRFRGGGVRLLTLTGPGGVGKTRLGLEAARAVEPDFAAGARFVSLAALRRAQDVPAAIVRTLRIVPLSGETLEQAVTRFLSAKELLLVLDNVEHVLSAAGFVSELLAACPSLTVLATSREPLALAGEQRYPVAPLALPLEEDDADSLARVPAVALFCERARAHDPDFRLCDANADAVAEICRRLDGLPLAIELAAARCGLLTPGEIAERLDAALGALGAGARDAPARQRTLRATIDWSHDLLSDAERQCFARFAVFVGGASVQAAETIMAADLDTLDRLVAKSLLVRVLRPRSVTRLLMLETIRAYASEQFAASADNNAVRERHCRHYLALAQLHGTERALRGAQADEHLAVLDADIDNFDEALRWAVAQRNAELALALVRSLGDYWHARNRFAHAVDWIDRALRLPDADAHPALRARALLAKIACLWPIGRGTDQAPLIEEAAAIADKLGEPALMSRVLQWRSLLEAAIGHLDAGTALADDALRRAIEADDDWEIAMASVRKALTAPTLADLRDLVDEAAARANAVGNVTELASLLGSAAYSALLEGSDRDARMFLDRAEPIAQTLDDPAMLTMVRGNAGLVAVFARDTDAARRAFREELEFCRETVYLPYAREGLLGLAAVAAIDGDVQRAARLVGAADVHRYAAPDDRVHARLHAAFFEDARTRYGADAWDATARDGAALSFEDAVAYALEQPRA